MGSRHQNLPMLLQDEGCPRKRDRMLSPSSSSSAHADLAVLALPASLPSWPMHQRQCSLWRRLDQLGRPAQGMHVCPVHLHLQHLLPQALHKGHALSHSRWTCRIVCRKSCADGLPGLSRAACFAAKRPGNRGHRCLPRSLSLDDKPCCKLWPRQGCPALQQVC